MSSLIALFTLITYEPRKNCTPEYIDKEVPFSLGAVERAYERVFPYVAGLYLFFWFGLMGSVGEEDPRREEKLGENVARLSALVKEMEDREQHPV